MLEQNENKFINLVDHLVDGRLRQVLERLQRRLIDAVRSLVFALAALDSAIDDIFCVSMGIAGVAILP